MIDIQSNRFPMMHARYIAFRVVEIDELFDLSDVKIQLGELTSGMYLMKK